jgi:cytoskeletal protein CcmA (bactofilin family)
MFEKMKDKRPDNDRAAMPQPDNGIGRMPQPQQPAVASPAVAQFSAAHSSTASSSVAQPAGTPASSAATSLISSSMTLVGKLVGDGAVTIFGRIEGELQASSILICEGAHVEGSVVAKELTIGGHVKGTIHATRVKLNGTAVVDGDIYHRSLSIEENARFEGSSRREENPTDKPSGTLLSGASAAGGNVRAANPQIASSESAGFKSRLYSDEASNPLNK